MCQETSLSELLVKQHCSTTLAWQSFQEQVSYPLTLAPIPRTAEKPFSRTNTERTITTYHDMECLPLDSKSSSHPPPQRKEHSCLRYVQVIIISGSNLEKATVILELKCTPSAEEHLAAAAAISKRVNDDLFCRRDLRVSQQLVLDIAKRFPSQNAVLLPDTARHMGTARTAFLQSQASSMLASMVKPSQVRHTKALKRQYICWLKQALRAANHIHLVPVASVFYTATTQPLPRRMLFDNLRCLILSSRKILMPFSTA